MAVSTNDSLRERRRCHRGITSLVLRGNAYGRRSEETVGRGTPMNEERRQHLLESRFTRPQAIVDAATSRELHEPLTDDARLLIVAADHAARDRKSTRLNSSHLGISYAV